MVVLGLRNPTPPLVEIKFIYTPVKIVVMRLRDRIREYRAKRIGTILTRERRRYEMLRSLGELRTNFEDELFEQSGKNIDRLEKKLINLSLRR